MSITEDELVDSYGTGNAKERFDLIYENYSVFPQLVDCFEIGLFNTILNEKEYNRRAKNNVAPITTGTSFWRIAVVRSVPIPGIAKTVSAIIAPPKEAPKLVPIVVITGISALRSA